MRYRPNPLSCLILAIGVLWGSTARVTAQSTKADEFGEPRASVFAAAAQVPLEQMTAGVREKVRTVLEHPTLCTHGPAEVFNCQPALYHWFLDHPDRAAVVWRRLGAKCVEMTDRGNGRFGWSDKLGSDVHWDTVYRGPRMRVWHAEGQVRPAPLLPLVLVQAVVVLRYAEGRDSDGKPLLRHQADLLVHTDSKTAALAARVLGASAPRMAEQYVAQVQTFFAALAWRLDRVPAKKEAE